MVESGLFHYQHFLQSARRYREGLGNFLDRKYPLPKDHPLDRGSTDQVLTSMKLDFDSIPKFEDRFAPVNEVDGPLLWNAGILLILNLVLFAAAHVSFLRYDVR